MTPERVAPDQIRIVQPGLDPRGAQGVASDRIKEKLRVLVVHRREVTGAATVTVERNPEEDDPPIVADIEVREYTVFLKAETKPPAAEWRQVLDQNGHGADRG